MPASKAESIRGRLREYVDSTFFDHPERPLSVTALARYASCCRNTVYKYVDLEALKKARAGQRKRKKSPGRGSADLTARLDRAVKERDEWKTRHDGLLEMLLRVEYHLNEMEIDAGGVFNTPIARVDRSTPASSGKPEVRVWTHTGPGW
ncbi:MAG TPA: hypothetical protein VF647_22720 [Longimicrobium sp.]|jgi:hypothetical protein